MKKYEIHSYTVKIISDFSHRNVGAIVSCASEEKEIEMHFQYDGLVSPPLVDKEGHLLVFLPCQALDTVLTLLRTSKQNILVHEEGRAELLSNP
ncbi:MAG: hypothetical protein P1U86_10695 [Verrucomicrobiales bacterium]|nr:hypothetical protein [Verrucomicrobiales bacterium]